MWWRPLTLRLLGVVQVVLLPIMEVLVGRWVALVGRQGWGVLGVVRVVVGWVCPVRGRLCLWCWLLWRLMGPWVLLCCRRWVRSGWGLLS